MCVWVIFFGLSDGNKNIRILFPFPLPLQPVGIHSRIRFLSVFMLCLKTDGLVLFVSFFLPLSPPGRGKLFACFQLGQMRILLLTADPAAGAGAPACRCGVPLPPSPTASSLFHGSQLGTSMPSEALLSVLPPSHSFACP